MMFPLFAIFFHLRRGIRKLARAQPRSICDHFNTNMRKMEILFEEDFEILAFRPSAWDSHKLRLTSFHCCLDTPIKGASDRVHMGRFPMLHCMQEYFRPDYSTPTGLAWCQIILLESHVSVFEMLECFPRKIRNTTAGLFIFSEFNAEKSKCFTSQEFSAMVDRNGSKESQHKSLVFILLLLLPP